MKTTINGHDVIFSSVGGDYPYSLSVDGLHISSYDTFEAAERRAHAICEHYPAVDPRKLELLNVALAWSRDTPDLRSERQAKLGELGALAIPPTGHSCPFCNRVGELYCSAIAAERIRGLRS